MSCIEGIDAFKDIDSDMLWNGAAVTQLATFETVIANLIDRFGGTAAVVGSHRSKSIELPVVMLSTAAGEFTLRDNFHDANLMAVLPHPARLSLDAFFYGVQEPLTWEWYLAQIERARNYSWCEWTDEEIADPRVLRVQAHGGSWFERTPDQKERWIARMSDPAWYCRDWSRGELTWEGEFGPGVKLYNQAHAFAEGITVITTNHAYRQGVRDFIIATKSLTTVAALIARLH